MVNNERDAEAGPHVAMLARTLRVLIGLAIFAPLLAQADEREDEPELVAPAPHEHHKMSVHFMGGVDFFGSFLSDATPAPTVDCTKTPSDPTCAKSFTANDAELGIALKAMVHNLAGFIDLHLDFRDREVFTGDVPSVHQLHDLSVVFNRLAGHLDLEIGRFAVPGGFWLITDGGRVRIRFGQYFAVEAFGGLRAYNSAREDLDLAVQSDDRAFLPLVGGAIVVDHPKIHGSLAYTYSQDKITFYRGLSPDGGAFALSGRSTGQDVEASSIQPEMFLDGQVIVLPHPTLFLTGGLTLGSRYQVTFPTAPGTLVMAPSVDVAPIASFMAYAVAEWRPVKRLRLSYSLDFDRVRLLVPTSPCPTGNCVAPPTTVLPTAAGGSFEDHTLKGSFRLWKALRVEGRYRLRFRENTDIIHRFEGGLIGDDLLFGIGLFATVGGDIYQFSRTVPANLSDRNNIVYTGGLSFVRSMFDGRLGVLYTDSIGNGFAFSTHAQQAMGAGPSSELFPLVLESQRIAYLRLFVTTRGLFAGLDAELNLDASQLRAMVQLGYAQ
jgi:hypothetical protein